MPLFLSIEKPTADWLLRGPVVLYLSQVLSGSQTDCK
jgi:hypothetical protein